MKLTAKFACALAATYLCIFGGAWLTLEHLIGADFRRIEVDQHERDVRRVNANVAAYRKELAARAADYADWDETRAFLTGGNQRYPDENFNKDWFESYDVDLALFVDAEGRIIWGRNRTGAGDLEAGAFLFNIVLSQARSAAPTPEKPAVGVAWTQHGPLLYAARPARNSLGVGEPVGLVVLGRYLSAAQLGEQAQLDLDVVDLASSAADGRVRSGLTQLRRDRVQEVSWTESGRRSSLITLRGADGRAVGAIYARHKQTFAPLGSHSIMVAAALLSAVFALTLLALWRLLEVQVTSRLRALERHFNGQDEDLKPAPAPTSTDEIGRLVVAYNALVDRTQQALAREQQAMLDREAHARADQLKTAFIANMSHELRTPLTAILGYCELVQDDLRAGDLASGGDDLARVERAARELLARIEEVLDMAKIEAGEIELNPRSFDVRDMLQATVDAAMPAAIQSGNTLSLHCLGELGFARTDGVRLRHSLERLLSNACKFTRDGEIIVRAERMRIDNAAWLRMEVHDSGEGMNAEQVTYIFEPFMQVDNSATRKHGGIGLGLAITKRLVTLLGGTIAVRSRQGYGTMFVISVPAALEDSTSSRAAA